jgi:hypothetical protein
MSVTSRRTTSEKKPWKFVASLKGVVERRFVVPVHLGETVLPFRLLEPLLAVLPISDTEILSASKVEENTALAAWWQSAENTWDAGKVKSDTSSLLERIDYHGQLSAQLPAARHRVLYTASGNTLAAVRIDDPRPVIEHKLYWAAASGIDEARYLTAILNSELVLERVKPLMALGLFGARDFDKNVFSVPIPTFDRDDPDHQELVRLSELAETQAAGCTLDPALNFKQARAQVRAHLTGLGVTTKIEAVVARVVPVVTVESAAEGGA